VLHIDCQHFMYIVVIVIRHVKWHDVDRQNDFILRVKREKETVNNFIIRTEYLPM